ncbi:MAG: protoporphyrinogen oxidase HemJ, partial [Phormidium sp.]
FYIVRLFVYHAEAEEKPEPAKTILKQQYEIMEKRLFNMITTPGMVIASAMAIAIIFVEPDILNTPWLQFKLLLVAVLIGYHFYCGRIIKQLAAGTSTWKGEQFRILNEVPTVLLLAIILLAVFKQSLPVNSAIASVVALTLVIVATFKIYTKVRQQNESKMDLATKSEV